MKKLLILSSLALLVAPSFSSNLFSNIAKEEGAFFDAVEGGDSSSEVSEESTTKTATIYFGDAASSSTSYGSEVSSSTDTYPWTSIDGVSIDNSKCSFTRCYAKASTVSNQCALKMGSTSGSGKITIAFEKLNIKSVNIYASKWDSTGQPTYKLSAGNGFAGETITINTTKNNTTDFQLLSWNSIGETTSITFEGTGTIKKAYRIFVQKIELIIASSNDDSSSSSEEATKHTVTYDYGTTRVTGKTSEEVIDGKTATNPLTDGYTYEDWDGTHKLVGWYKKDETEFDFNTAITEDITLYAKWEISADSTDITNIKNSFTKAQLNYKYEFDESDSTYNISDIGMRFGGTIKESYYNAIKSHIKSFGMVYTTKDKLDSYNTLTAALEKGVSESTFTVKEETLTETTAPVTQTIDNETYYVWYVYLNVSSSSLDKTVYAVGKLTLDNNETYYLTEKIGSVESLAEYYFDNELYSDDIQMHTLFALASGDTKTESIKSSSSTDTSSSSSEEGE